jgi:hypothetical protein
MSDFQSCVSHNRLEIEGILQIVLDRKVFMMVASVGVVAISKIRII